MTFFRGDAHKLYVQLKNETDFQSNRKLKEVAEIQSFYQATDSATLQLIYYRMKKEQNGLGIIPIFATSIPWLLFLFSNKIQDLLFKNGSKLWIIFVFAYLIVLTVSILLHFKEKAWAALHIAMIKDILDERKKKI